MYMCKCPHEHKTAITDRGKPPDMCFSPSFKERGGREGEREREGDRERGGKEERGWRIEGRGMEGDREIERGRR